MRIGIDARYLNGEYSGIANYSKNLLRALSRLDASNEYVVYVHPDNREALGLNPNFTVKTYPARAVSLKTLWDFGCFVGAHRLDLLHSLYPISPLTFDGPTLLTVHDLQPFLVSDFTAQRNPLLKLGYDLYYRFSYPASIRRARYLLAVSHATRRAIAKMFPARLEDTLVIHNGLDESFLNPGDESFTLETLKKYQLPGKYIFYIGSTRSNKNLPNMVRAFARLLQAPAAAEQELLRELHLILIVNPDRFFSECRNLLREFNLQQRIRIIREISDEEKKVFYRNAQALYFVTKHEGFGFPILEAQALGCPVLTARHSALPEVAGDGALLADPNSVEEIARGLETILCNRPMREQLIRNGHANVKKFSWHNSAQRLLEIYRNLY